MLHLTRSPIPASDISAAVASRLITSDEADFVRRIDDGTLQRPWINETDMDRYCSLRYKIEDQSHATNHTKTT